MALREVEVRFTNGNKLLTSMNARLTDAEIRAYYRVGRVFNVGVGAKDRMTKVKSVRILK
ncbi:MAG: hypothetical protein JRE40_14965 [Deltaproteobacteria bacterium]|nr:hypothetical protein [Deltaproteobacteria bacterium]